MRVEEFRYEDVHEGQNAYQVYCDIYRNGELIEGASPCIPELVIMDEDDPILEEKMLAIADEYIELNIKVRIAENMLLDPSVSGSVEEGCSLRFTFKEPGYNAEVVEIYDNFRVVLVHDYLWCSLTDAERISRVNETDALFNPNHIDVDEA